MATTKRVRGKSAADNAAAGSTDGEGRTVSYVVNRPYSAGEHPEVVTAFVKKVHDDDEDVLDLALEPGSAAAFRGVRRSDAREPGTWHETPPAPPADETEGGE